MESGRSVAGTAVVTFGSAREAGRRVAGVAAAGRIVRELAKAGVSEAWLVLPRDEALGRAAQDDVRRLRGPMIVHCHAGDPPAALKGRGDEVMFLAGNRLLPAEAIAHDGAAGPATVRLDHPRAGAEILRATGKPGDGPISRWLNRPISRFLSGLLLRVPGFRPFHATLGTALLAALMFFALVAGGTAGLIVGGLLFQAASIFDGVDGEVARATFRSSRGGAVLDTAVDVATNLLLIVGLTVNLTSSGHQEAVSLAAWGLALFVLGLAAIAWRASRAAGAFSLDTVKHHYRSRFPAGFGPRLIGFLTTVTSRDFFALLFAALIVAGLPMAVLYLFAAAATVWILFVIASLGMPERSALASRSA
jgi:phosphatidylglycerophosphate synthase